MKDLQTERKRLFFAVLLLLLAFFFAAFGIVTAKYVREEKSGSVSVTVEYKQNYLAPKASLPASSATKLVFTTLDNLSTYNVAYEELTDQADAGYDDVTAATTGAIRYGYDATANTGYFISMTNRPIVPYSCVQLFYQNTAVTAIDFGATVTVGGVEVPLFDTSTVTDMSGMFSGCSALTTLDLSKFNTSNVTKMSTMFSSCSSLASLDLSAFDTSKVTSLRMMFMNSASLSSLDLSAFDTSSVTDMCQVFYYCSNLASLNLSGWDTSSATDMTYMFGGCSVLASLDVSGFKTSKVKDMTGMFRGCSALASLDVSKWDTSSVTSMTFMFAYCDKIATLDLSGWNTSNVKTMDTMFSSCTSLAWLDLSGFKVSSVYKTQGMFSGCTNLQTIYASYDWALTGTTTSMFAGCAALEGGAGTKFDSTHTDGAYAVIDCGTEKPGYFTAVTLSDIAINAAMVKGVDHIVFGKTSNHTADIANAGNGSAFAAAYYEGKMVTSRSILGYTVTDANGETTLYVLSSVAPIIAPASCQYLFSDPSVRLETITFEREYLTNDTSRAWFDTSKVTDMSYMFYSNYGNNERAKKQINGLDTFNTSNVTNMSFMFYGTSYLQSLDVSSFDTSKVTDMNSMFTYFGKDYVSDAVANGEEATVALDVSGFDTSLVTDMSEMFRECSGLASLDLSGWNTVSVTDMEAMFDGCSALETLDVSKFDTSNVTKMKRMFYNCTGLTSLDLTNWNTSNMENMVYLFSDCSNLKTIYVGDYWNIQSETASTGMFYNCTSLVGGAGTKFDSTHTDGAYAHIDGGTANPGYLTGPTFAKDEFTALAETVNHIVFGKASNHSDVVYDTTATVTPLALVGTTSSRAVTGYTVTDANDETTLYVLSEVNPIVAPADCSSLFGRISVMATTITFEREDLNDAASRAWFDTSLVTNMSRMFYNEWEENYCYLKNIYGLDTFNTSNVTDMSHMFDGTSYLQSLDVSSFDTSKVTNMNSMFMYYGMDYIGDAVANGEEATVALDVSGFNTSLVTDMSYMFYDCWGLITLDVSGFDTSNVTDMGAMFSGCQVLASLDVSGFNTSNVTDMSDMFYNCSGLTSLDLSNWDTSNVTNMRTMFSDCTNLKSIYVSADWNTQNVTVSNAMFYNCKALEGGAGTKFDSTQPTDKTYAVIDGQNGQKGYLTLGDTLDTARVHTLLAENSENITNVVFGSTADHSDVTAGATAIPVSFAGNSVNCYLTEDTAYFLSEQPIKVYYDASNLFKELTTIQSITFESVGGTAWFDTSNVTDMSGMFEAKQDGDTFTSALVTIKGLETFDTSNVTNMARLFRHCESLTTSLDLSSWNTPNVTSMEAMFDGLHSVTSITFGSGFDTSKVTSMKHMFNECKSLNATLDVSMFDTSLVTDMFAMFNMCNNLEHITFGEKFDTQNVTDMSYMFAGNWKLMELELPSTFDTQNVKYMENMFSGCYLITELDLSTFNTQKVTTMYYMFSWCYNLKTIYVGDGWVIGDTTNTEGMFADCNAVVGGSGTTYSEAYTDGEYARVDGAMLNDQQDAELMAGFAYCGTPGYLTAKNSMPSGAALNALLRENLTTTVTNLVIGSAGGGVQRNG